MKSLKTSIRMKNDLEEIIKSALEKHELPYQEGAWESFEKKMVAKSSNQSVKWWISSMALVIGAISIMYFLNKNKTKIKSATKNESEIEQVAFKTTENKPKKEQVRKILAQKKENLNSIKKEIHSVSSYYVKPNLKTTENVNSIINSSYQVFSSDFINSTKSDEIDQSKNEYNHQKITKIENIPAFSDKCKNETIFIDNKNSFELILRTPSGREIGIESDSKSEINLKEIGVYHLGYVNAETNETFNETSKFSVFALPEVNLNLDDAVSFRNGLPIINAESNSSEEYVIWKINQSVSNKIGKSTEFNLFNKGSYTISVQSKNEFGCESKDSKTIQVNEDYNLLAMSAFNPNSSDFRNNVFLPYALKERNSAFKMVILDPDNGGIVFETSESTNPWTGIDRRDGKLVVAQKAYIWKVLLSNPEPGEKAEYKGTIVRVP